MKLNAKVKIRIIAAFPNNPTKQFRVIEDLLPYQSSGVELSLSHNSKGPIHCQNDIEHAMAIASMPQAALLAEQEGADAIVIESMGDTGLIPCREAVKIPVVGLSESALRTAQMLGRKFGLITAGAWHGYSLERLMQSYGLHYRYVGFSALNLQPFFSDAESETKLQEKIIKAALKLIKKDADTIVLGGSYFLGKNKNLSESLVRCGYPDIIVIDPLPLAIHCAHMLVQAGLSHSKKIYVTPKHKTPIIGYS